MKWYNFAPLSLLVCTLSALLGWYVGGSDQMQLLTGLIAVGICLIVGKYGQRIFRRIFPHFKPNIRYSMLSISAIIIYAVSVIMSDHYHFYHPISPEISLFKYLF